MKYVAFIMFSAVFICTAALAGQADTTTTQAPSALHLKIAGNGFQLDWTLSPQDPDGVTGYEIVRADIFSGPYETVGKVKQGVSSFVDRTVKPEVIYFYKVRALSGSQPSPFSKEAAGEVMGNP